MSCKITEENFRANLLHVSNKVRVVYVNFKKSFILWPKNTKYHEKNNVFVVLLLVLCMHSG